MAEIKSTLDLVMERTKHLTLSTEERAGQQRKDFEKKLNGLLQQYEDKLLSVDELMERNAALQADLNLENPMLAVLSVVKRIQPGMDNAHWLALIKRLAPAGVTQLEDVLADSQEKVAALVRKKEQHHLESLARDYGIQGSAVVPNLQKDAPLQDALLALKNETLTRIEGIFQDSN